MATANPKNYQLWNHRRRLALALGPAQAEEVRASTCGAEWLAGCAVPQRSPPARSLPKGAAHCAIPVCEQP